jgi:uncharacterized repeat protein (TIGR03803 family)
VQGFVLTNDSSGPLSWSVANIYISPWLDFAPAGGTLTNGGTAGAVNLTLTSMASTLQVGSYPAILWFTDLSSGLAQSRRVSLDIVAPPVITSQPINQTVLEGMTASFTVAVASSASLSYQWQYDNGKVVTDLTDGGNLSGATSSTLLIANTVPAQAGAYSVVVSSAAGAVASSQAFLGVLPWRPVMTEQPADQTVLAGQAVTFTVEAVGEEPLFYLWQRNGSPLSDGGNISGAASRSLTLHSASLADAGTYSVVVGNADGVAVSSGAVLTVTSVTAPGTTLATVYSFSGGNDGGNPNALLRAGNGAFYGTTQNGGTNLAGTVFQMTAAGAVTDLYSFSGGDDGANPQAALIEDADGSLLGTTQNGGASNAGVIYRLSFSGAPQLTAQPAGQTVYAGDTVLLNVAVIGASPLSYQWQKNGTNLVNGGNLSGAAARLLALGSVTLADIGTYSVIVSNALGSVRSADAVLSVISSPPFITLQPTNQSPAPGATVTFAVTAFGNSPLSYQWQRNGTNLADGANLSGSGTSALTLFNVVEADNGTYSVIVSNVLSSVTSAGAVLTVIPVSAPGTRLATLHSFSSTGGGGWPPNGLMSASNGVLYGTTQFGRSNSFSGPGTAFRLTTNGFLTTLVSFAVTNGSLPQAALAQGSDGNLYGTTKYGGTNFVGSVFQMTPDGSLTNLYSFEGGADGIYPDAPLLPATDGNLYGTTPTGGDSGSGNVFTINPAGAFTNLYSFTGGLDGDGPTGALVQGADGNFYGLTPYGGASGKGNAFRITPGGVLTTLYSFTGGTDGYSPAGAMIRGADGNFYGVTTHSVLSGIELFGTTTSGGTGGRGTVFRLSFTGSPQITGQPASHTVVGGVDALFNVAVSGARSFTYQWQKNGTNLVDGGNLSGPTNRTLSLASVSLADAATYSVVVSNALGSATSAGARLTVVYPPVFLATVKSNCTLTLTWSAAAGQRYRLQSSTNLATTNWTFQGGFITASGSSATASDNTCTNARKFYRVVLLP